MLLLVVVQLLQAAQTYLQEADSMTGMQVSTGRSIGSELEHIKQSIADILTTPVNSRLMRRDYGSVLPELIDHPLNPKTILRLYAAIAIAIIRWEPRYQLTDISLARNESQVMIEINGTTNAKPNNISIRL
jgi:phage baseplate assembly protein W